MQTMSEAYGKANKKAGKSKKRKNCDHDSSDSSDSEYETGCGDTRSRVDKHLKIDKPLGTAYFSTEHHQIKVTSTAPSDNMRANVIPIETAKTGKVTAVVVVMSIFCKKRCSLQRANPGNKKPSHQKTESTNFSEEKYRKLRNLSQKTRKGRLPKKFAPKLKKIELNSTNLRLKTKKTCCDCAKKHDPSIDYGLKVKNKTIRVLLDSGSSDDLLFMKKGSSKCISIAKRVVPQLSGTSNGTFVTDR